MSYPLTIPSKTVVFLGRWIVVLALVIGFGTQLAIAQYSEKASREVQERMATGNPQDLFVVFDDKVIQEDVATFQRAAQLPSNHRAVIDQKAIRFAQKKLQVFANLGLDEAAVLREYDHLPITFVRIYKKAALDRFLADSSVVGVYENSVFRRTGSPNLNLIGQPQAIAAGDQGAGTSVAVLDLRVDYTQPAFGPCSSPGVPLNCKVIVAQDVPGLPNDGLGPGDGHGTNVAGVVLGVAPGTQIISLNVFNGESASSTEIVAGIDWCIAHASTYNIVAMNLSIGGGPAYTSPVTASPYYSAFANALSANILPIVAAGNDGYINGLTQPGAVVGAVSVGAVYDMAWGPYTWNDPSAPPVCTDQSTADDQITCFSDSAYYLTLLAPGCPINAANTSFCGTSQATPHVAGAVAVLRAAYPSETLTQTVARLTNGVAISDARNGVARPRLNLPAALGLQACVFTMSPTAASVAVAGVTGTISVTTATGCSWSAVSNFNWITVLSGSSGTGNGTVEISVDPNPNAGLRSGTLTIAGQTITLSQPGGATSLSLATNVWLLGNYRYSYEIAPSISVVTLQSDEILHSTTGTTGTLRLELWLSTVPFSLSGTGYRVATYPISISGDTTGQLGAFQYFSNISSGSVPLGNLPSPGSYYATLLVTQYDPANCQVADHFCSVTFGGFNGQFYVPDITPPTVPAGLTATPAGTNQINLAWNASADNVGVSAYWIYLNGTLLGRVLPTGASIINLSPSTLYQFNVSACDVANNCSAQSAPAFATTQAVTPTVQPQAGYWWNPAEPGRGFVIEIQGSDMFMAGFLYDTIGNATWVASSGKMSSQTQYSGSLITYGGGQTLTGSFQAATPVSPPLGTISINFTSSTQGTLSWPGGTIPIQRYEFVAGGLNSPPTATQPQPGWWWNPNEGGRGFSIEVQNSTAFIASYMYGNSGEAVWYAAGPSALTSGTYQGNWTSYFGGQTLIGAYQAPTGTTNAGSLTIQFSSPTAGTLTLPNGRQIPIQRFAF